LSRSEYKHRLFEVLLLPGSLLLSNLVVALLLVEALLLVGLGLVASSGLLLLGQLGAGVLTDSSVSLSVHVLDIISSDVTSNEASELLLVTLLIFVLEVLHVLRDVDTVDVVAEKFSIKRLALNVETGETVLTVGDVDTTIRGTLDGTEETGTSGGTLETDIKESLEGTGAVLDGLSHLDSAIGLSDTLILLIKTELGKSTTSNKETSSVGGSPVGQTTLDTIAGKLVGVGGSKNVITLELGIDDLADDVLVGETDNESVLGRVVLVLGLNNQTLAGVVVGLTLSSSSVLDLEALEVGLVLLLLDERLCISKDS